MAGPRLLSKSQLSHVKKGTASEFCAVFSGCVEVISLKTPHGSSHLSTQSLVLGENRDSQWTSSSSSASRGPQELTSYLLFFYRLIWSVIPIPWAAVARVDTQLQGDSFIHTLSSQIDSIVSSNLPIPFTCLLVQHKDHWWRHRFWRRQTYTFRHKMACVQCHAWSSGLLKREGSGRSKAGRNGIPLEEMPLRGSCRIEPFPQAGQVGLFRPR